MERSFIQEEAMRSIFLKDIIENDVATNEIIEIDGKNAHHLIRVVRLKIGEKVLILNGHGIKAISEVKTIDRKVVRLSIISSELVERKHNIDLAICMPKKDALEDIIKKSVELGFTNLIPVVSKFSTGKIKDYDRAFRLAESAIIQSNNAFGLNIENEYSFDLLVSKLQEYDIIVYCDSRGVSQSIDRKMSINDRVLVIIGPEGGLDTSEEDLLSNVSNVIGINFPTYILRSPTAVSTATGYILAKMAE